MYNMLVVDDELKLLAGLCDYYPWRELGFQIVGRMANGKQALDFIKNNKIDVLLTDISMPIMTGIELAKMVSQNHPQIKIVFLSGFADFKYAQMALKYGVQDYILKPVKSDEITTVFTKIKKILDYENNSNSIVEVNESYYEKVIRLVDTYIIDNLDKVTLEEASEKVNLSAGYLSTLYKQETGITFSDFILKTKMERAKELLMDIENKTYNVAEILGYENPKNFTRAFRIFYGMSPREFKRSINTLGEKNEKD